jgi:hypothetical protein
MFQTMGVHGADRITQKYVTRAASLVYKILSSERPESLVVEA